MTSKDKYYRTKRRKMNRRDFLKTAGLTAAALVVPGCSDFLRTSGRTSTDKPNLVIVFCDDVGYADVGVFGAKGYQTPNLDRMAAEGVKFTDFYAAAPSCTPSRAALMTGCYPQRVSLQTRWHSVVIRAQYTASCQGLANGKKCLF